MARRSWQGRGEGACPWAAAIFAIGAIVAGALFEHGTAAPSSHCTVGLARQAYPPSCAWGWKSISAARNAARQFSTPGHTPWASIMRGTNAQLARSATLVRHPDLPKNTWKVEETTAPSDEELGVGD
jgi:hypothetical protein